MVANFGSSNVSLIDVATNKLLGAITVGDPNGIAITPDGTRAYVTNFRPNTVSVIEVANPFNKVVGSPIPVGRAPVGIAIAVVTGP